MPCANILLEKATTEVQYIQTRLSHDEAIWKLAEPPVLSSLVGFRDCFAFVCGEYSGNPYLVI